MTILRNIVIGSQKHKKGFIELHYTTVLTTKGLLESTSKEEFAVTHVVITLLCKFCKISTISSRLVVRVATVALGSSV